MPANGRWDLIRRLKVKVSHTHLLQILFKLLVWSPLYLRLTIWVYVVWSSRLRHRYFSLQTTVRKYVYKVFILGYWLSVPIRRAPIWLLFYPPTFPHSPHHRFFFYHGVWPTRSPSSILLNSLLTSSSSLPGANLWYPLKQHLSSSSRLYYGPSFSETSPNYLTSTGLFISPSGISELDFATTKTDTAERSISIGRESL